MQITIDHETPCAPLRMRLPLASSPACKALRHKVRSLRTHTSRVTVPASLRSPEQMAEQQEQPVRLTQLSHGGGCGCKIAPAKLQQVRLLSQCTQGSNTFDNPPVAPCTGEHSMDLLLATIHSNFAHVCLTHTALLPHERCSLVAGGTLKR